MRLSGREHVMDIKLPSLSENVSEGAVLELRAEHGVDPNALAGVHLYVGQTNLEFCEPAAARRKPQGRMDALSSLPFAVEREVGVG